VAIGPFSSHGTIVIGGAIDQWRPRLPACVHCKGEKLLYCVTVNAFLKFNKYFPLFKT